MSKETAKPKTDEKKTKAPTPKLVESAVAWNGLINSRKLQTNPAFPFSKGQKVLVRLDGDKLVVEKADVK